MATGSPKAKGSLQLGSPWEEKWGSEGWGRGAGGEVGTPRGGCRVGKDTEGQTGDVRVQLCMSMRTE